MTDSDLIDLLREEVDDTSQSEFARRIGVQPSLINDILHGRKPVFPKVAKALGYQRIVTWEPLHSISDSV